MCSSTLNVNSSFNSPGNSVLLSDFGDIFSQSSNGLQVGGVSHPALFPITISQPSNGLQVGGVSHPALFPITISQSSNALSFQHPLFNFQNQFNQLDGGGKPIKVGSYNIHYQSWGANADVIEDMSQTHDIFGLQEVANGNAAKSVGNNMAQIAGFTLDTHDVFVGTGQNGPHDGEYSPIFYSKERYEAVYTESIQLHGQNFDNQGGPGRVANFVILKDKTDGSTLLVVNTHWSNTSPAARELSESIINDQIKELQGQYPIDGVVVLGDFNEDVPFGQEDDSWVNVVGGEAYTSSDTGIDLVLTDSNITQNHVEILDGGTSDHDIASVEIQLNSISQDPRKDSLENVNFGGVAFEGSNYSGEAWIFGFGTDPGPHEGWNDEISSVMVGSDTTITFGKDSAHIEEGAFSTSGNVANVGEEFNDQFSSFEVAPTPG